MILLVSSFNLDCQVGKHHFRKFHIIKCIWLCACAVVRRWLIEVLSGQISASSICLNNETPWPLIICSHQPPVPHVTHGKTFLTGRKHSQEFHEWFKWLSTCCFGFTAFVHSYCSCHLWWTQKRSDNIVCWTNWNMSQPRAKIKSW